MKRVAFIVNSLSSHAERVLQEIEQARKDFPDLEIEVKPTKAAGDSFRFAYNRTRSQFDAIISCGGDGTMNEVLNGILGFPSEKKPVIGVHGSGNANDFLRTFPEHDARELLTLVQEGKSTLIDCGRLDYLTRQRFFLNSSSAGLGALVHRDVQGRRKNLPPKLNYSIATAKWLMRFKPAGVKVELNDETITDDFKIIIIGQGVYTGMGLGLSPQARLDNGLLAVTLVRNAGIQKFLKHYGQMQRAKVVPDPAASYHEAGNVKLTVLNGQLPVETDGEYFQILEEGNTIEFTVVPQHVTILG